MAAYCDETVRCRVSRRRMSYSDCQFGVRRTGCRHTVWVLRGGSPRIAVRGFVFVSGFDKEGLLFTTCHGCRCGAWLLLRLESVPMAL